MKLIERLSWAKENLVPYQTEYRIVYENPGLEGTSSIVAPDPNWMACALHGNIIPPVWVYLELAKDEAHPDFKQHTRGHLLHTVKPIGPMTEEEAIEYLIIKDVPQNVWRNFNKGNRPKMVICRASQIPQEDDFRGSWTINENIFLEQKATKE